MDTIYQGEKKREIFEKGLEQPSYIREWLGRNTFHHSRFRDAKRLVRKKKEQGCTISLCFPTLNEEKTVGKEIALLKREIMEKHPLLDEIVVVDSGSTDNTSKVSKQAGAEFYLSSEILPQYRSYRGKGENLWKSLFVLKGDIICWIDADITNIHPRFVLGLVGPLLEYPHLSYVKAFYRRPIRIKGELHYTGGGRVTELVVRPFFNLLFPELTGIAQPLSGEYAGRRQLLEKVPFFTGYGVETGHLIDISRLFGLDVIGQCDLNVRIHRNQSIEALRSVSYRILQILLQRADDLGRIEIFQDLSDSLQVITGIKHEYSIEKMKVWGIERPPMLTIREYREKRNIDSEEPKGATGEMVKPLPFTASLMFHKNLIIPRLKGKTKLDVIKEIVRVASHRVRGSYNVEKALMMSGKVVSTPIGKNIAFFHAFGDFADDMVPIIALSPEGVEVRYLDEETENISDRPAHIIFTFLAPEFLGETYSRIVESLTRIFSRMEHFEWLLRCHTPDEIIAFISYLESKNKILKMLNIEDPQQVGF
ncbi:MAG: glucosyl-3-phosphoglycerate synthase [Spirochaetota bacterium]